MSETGRTQDHSYFLTELSLQANWPKWEVAWQEMWSEIIKAADGVWKEAAV